MCLISKNLGEHSPTFSIDLTISPVSLAILVINVADSLNRNHLFSERQYVFSLAGSTYDVLTTITHKISEKLDKNAPLVLSH